jgi:hypothetical protein
MFRITDPELPHGPHVTDVFRYAIDKRALPLLLPFGVRPSKDGVTLTDDGRFVATFGLLRIETPLSNVEGAHVTSGYRWWTAIGARMSFVDDGLTFGTNNNAGVCVHFRERVGSRLRRSGHSALTVTVADLDGLTAALDATPRPPERP